LNSERPNVDVENTAILSFGGLIQRAFPFHAPVVKGDVEPAEFVDRKIHHPLDVRIFRDVGADESCVTAEFFISATTCAPSFSRRPVRTTFAPARANSMAVVLPIPDVPPVTSATLPENVLLFMELVFRCLLFLESVGNVHPHVDMP
jgi:hypothetical protein